MTVFSLFSTETLHPFLSLLLGVEIPAVSSLVVHFVSSLSESVLERKEHELVVTQTSARTLLSTGTQ